MSTKMASDFQIQTIDMVFFSILETITCSICFNRSLTGISVFVCISCIITISICNVCVCVCAYSKDMPWKHWMWPMWHLKTAKYIKMHTFFFSHHLPCMICIKIPQAANCKHSWHCVICDIFKIYIMRSVSFLACHFYTRTHFKHVHSTSGSGGSGGDDGENNIDKSKLI